MGRLMQEARDREAERSFLADQLVTAEQDERRRLSLALHDGPLQALSGIALMHQAALRSLEQGRTAEAVQVIEGALGREHELIRAVRDLSFAIEPVVLRDHGFSAAVQALADQVERARGIGVGVEVDAAGHLGDKAQVALYQTIREAVGQAVRRRPARISVTVEQGADGGYVARVADDGVAERRSANLEAIGERARILQGRVSVEPVPAGGTVVVVSLPPYVAGPEAGGAAGAGA
jgi:two-component system NarL family sensor kinase